ncbi:MAG: hypothetical protein AAGB22_15210, partial [Bacteroidota bacterium]
VNEGQNFCFDLDYQDPDGDSLFITVTGDVFDPNVTNPTATFTTPGVTANSVEGTFCWNTGCNQGRAQAYTFQVAVQDLGCPPLTLIQTVNVIVQPFNGPPAIGGTQLVCAGQSSETYNANFIQGVTYNWTVTGGTISSGNGTPSVVVDWGNGPTGTVSLTTTSAFGCTDGPITLPVDIVTAIVADAGPDQALCTGDTAQIGGTPTTNDATNTISWSPATGLSGNTDPNPFAFPGASTNYVLTVTDTLGCSLTDTVLVQVFPFTPSGLEDEYFLCPGDTIQITANGATHTWAPATGLSDPNVADPLFFTPASQTYTLQYADSNGCPGADTIDVTVGPVVPTDAGPSQSICFGEAVQLGG